MKNTLLILCLLATHFSTAQYNSLLWRISGNSLQQPSYLYGTMHASDERVFQFADSVMPAFQRTMVYAMELDPDQMLDMSLMSEMMMGKGKSLKKMLSDSDYRLLDSFAIAVVGVPLTVFDNMAPIVISALLEVASVGLNEDSGGSRPPLDLWLHQQAKEAKKKTMGIETVKEQLRALNALSYEEQAELLSKQLHEMQRGESEVDVLTFYTHGQLDSLAKYETENAMPPKFRKALLTDRNARMAARIGKVISDKPAFIAIGALHLPFAEGVIELLRKQGFRVEAVL